MSARSTRRTQSLRIGIVCTVVAGAAAYASTFVVSYDRFFRDDDPLVVSDVGRLARAHVAGVVAVRRVEDIRIALREARQSGSKVSIAGRRHSQGGQSFSDDVIVLDMLGFNRIHSIDTDAMTVTVDSGATWDRIQVALAAEGLALKVMQSSNVFTVGGSLSANAHGRDVDVTQLVDVVDRFGLMLADGSVVDVSQQEEPELFSLVIGGYGLYGVITDVTLRVARDELYEQQSRIVDYERLPDFFRQDIQSDPRVQLMIARPSIDPDPTSFLRDLMVVTWRRTESSDPGLWELTSEENVLRDRFFFGLSRRFDWAKALRWQLQLRHEPTLADAVIVSRNNAMRPPTAPLDFLDYYSSDDSDILQEYFVPLDEFVTFMDETRELLAQTDANLLSATIRYVSPDPRPVLAYTPSRESFGIVLLFNVGLSGQAQAQAEAMTRQLVDSAVNHGGTYYLTYQLYPTAAQLRAAYPRVAHALDRKRFYDPDELFSSFFYERYRESLATIY